MLIDPKREHEYLRSCSNVETCHYLATKVRQWRRAEGLSQVDFAARAEVPLRTYKRFESHGKANLETFIQVLRTLGRTQYLFMLFPVPASNRPSFEERLKQLTPTKFKA
jgi:transcriptional regulator with XRE-family HTH domain